MDVEVTLGGADIRITDLAGESHGYLFDPTQAAVLHTATSPNVPLNAAMSTPTQPGGQYDVRDTEGDKAITHLDWVQGEGQKTLDSEDSVYSRYLDSSYVDVSTKGELRLLGEAVSLPLMNSAGPVFSACGYVWWGSSLGTLKYGSPDGGGWTDATINGTTISSTIGGFATDGTRLYFGVSGGNSTGIWANTAAAVGTFNKLGSTPTTEAIQHLAYNGGFLFAATGAGAGTVDATTGVYTKATPAYLNVTNTTVALVSSGSAVHWVVAQGGRSYVYKLTYDPVTDAVLTEQEAEFPSGFIATCAVGYLGNVDVGGHYESGISGVGQGAVYRVAGGMSALLFEIGDKPESTPVPTGISNDHRIRAACSGSKDEYFLTERACYRWDMDDGGHSHVFDALGAGSLSRKTTETMQDALPTGGTITTAGQYTVHTFNSSGTLVVAAGTIAGKSLVVAGGGGGGSNDGGGGGAGGLLTGTQDLTGSMSVTVGDGGAPDTVGADSIFGTRTSKGGGKGGGETGGTGGSGGGAQYHGTSYGGNGTALQGHDGAAGDGTYAGGGGGAGAAATGVDGGAGLASTISGSSVIYASGGNGNGDIGGAANTGDGGDGSDGAGAAGGKGKVVVTYLTADAISSSPGLAADLFRPSLAYHRGLIFAPYAVGEDAVSLTISGNTQASPTIVTTTVPHGLVTGQVVGITGSNSNPLIDGNYAVTYNSGTMSTSQFSIAVNVATTAGTAGTVLYNHNMGWTYTSAQPNESGWLTQSPTTFHTGSMKKDFRYISVAHDALPAGSTVRPASWLIDGVYGTATGVAYSQWETRFAIDQKGYSIETTLGITPDYTGGISPVVRAVNVVWNFVKNKKHTYSLDCRSGANAGRWTENPETALQFLFTTTNERATFEDRFSGVYQGAIESVEFTPAPTSLSEGPSGLAKIVVREQA